MALDSAGSDGSSPEAGLQPRTHSMRLRRNTNADPSTINPSSIHAPPATIIGSPPITRPAVSSTQAPGLVFGRSSTRTPQSTTPFSSTDHHPLTGSTTRQEPPNQPFIFGQGTGHDLQLSFSQPRGRIQDPHPTAETGPSLDHSDPPAFPNDTPNDDPLAQAHAEAAATSISVKDLSDFYDAIKQENNTPFSEFERTNEAKLNTIVTTLTDTLQQWRHADLLAAQAGHPAPASTPRPTATAHTPAPAPPTAPPAPAPVPAPAPAPTASTATAAPAPVPPAQAAPPASSIPYQTMPQAAYAPAPPGHIPITMFQTLAQQFVKPDKLQLPKLSSASQLAYSTWKHKALCRVKAHRIFKPFVHHTVQQGLHLSSTMPMDLRDELYVSLTAAIDDTILSDIGIDTYTATDGVEILNRLETEFGFVLTSPIAKLQLVPKLSNCKLDSKESLSQYTTRFRHATFACQVNQVMPYTTPSDLHVLYLQNTRCAVFNQIILDMSVGSSNANDWLQLTDLDDVYKKAKALLRSHKLAFGTDPLATSSKPQTPSPASSASERLRRLDGFIKKNDGTAVLAHLKQRQGKKGGCFLHEGGKHSVFECAALRDLLKKHGKAHLLSDLKSALTGSKPSGNPSATAKRASQRAKARASKDRKELDRVKRRLDRKTKQVDDLLLALRTTATMHQTSLGNASVANPNPFAELQQDDDDESESEVEFASSDEEDDASAADDSSSVVSSSNDEVTSYSCLSSYRSRSSTPSLSPQHHSLSTTPMHTCKRLKSSPTLPAHLTVVDSGASSHMECNKSHFEYLIPVRDPHGSIPTVSLGDDSLLPIKGYGPVTKHLPSGHTIRYFAYYVPGLSCSLYSVMEHGTSQGCYFHSSNQEAILAFPSFIEKLSMSPEITFSSVASTKATVLSFNSETCPPSTLVKPIDCEIILPQLVHKDFSRRQLSALSQRATIHIHSITSLSLTLAPGSSTTIPTGIHFSTPSDISTSVSGIYNVPFSVDSIRSATTSSSDPLKLTIRNESSSPVHIKKDTILATFTFHSSHGADLLFLPSIPPRDVLRSTTHSSSKSSTRHRFRVFHTTNKSILVENGHSTHPKARRINRPISVGVRHPHTSHSPSSWTSHSLSSDEASDESPHLHQSTCDKSPISVPHPAAAPTVAPTPTEKVNSSLPSNVTITQEDLSQGIGFLRPDRLLRHLNVLGNGSLTVSGIHRTPTLDPGEAASQNAPRRNTTPSAPPKHYSDVWHLDIGYGPCSAHGGIKYTLLFVDKATRMRKIYPLKNLTTSLLRAVKRFFKDCKVPPKLLRTDFNPKLIHGSVAEYIEETKGVPIEAAPPNRQHQNGLVERSWQTAVSMTRNWLTSSLLPAKYWWFGMKRAIEVMNILPTNHIKHKQVTPHELVYGVKADYRTLIPLFSLAYIKQEREQGGQHKNKWRSRSLKCILVGTDPHSDGLQFFHPPSKQIITGGNGYRLDTSLPSGPQFQETYDGTFTFHTRSDIDCIHKPLTHEENATVYFQSPSNKSSYLQATILSAPIDDDTEPYTIQAIHDGSIHEYMAPDLLDHNPNATPTDPAPSSSSPPHPLHSWIIPDAKVTLFLPRLMNRPKQGYLRCSSDDSWSFSPGRSGNHPPIPLHNFSQLAPSLVTNKKLFRGWKSTKMVLSARYIRATSNLIARHVSAASLKVQDAPSLLRHHLLHPNDKKLWDKAYAEEYNGLVNLKTWEVITEAEYLRLRSVTGKALPTMAISKIKRDENGNPQRCKYRIVVLGNLDSHPWQKSDCFAPVLSQPEMRLLVSLAADMRRIPKSGDVSQAFCQGVLPPNEQYVIRPPAGCPHTPKNSYWKLLRTLYGLKRSPRHWYEKARKILLSIGLKPVKNSSCIFHGTVVKGHPPLYVGLYVDNFIYFSSSDFVEQQFEAKFGSQVTTTFEGDVTHFLGIAFHTTRHPDGHVSIHLGQEAFVESLQQRAGLDSSSIPIVPSPYRSGYPVDKIPSPDPSIDTATQQRYNHKLQQLTGSFQWLASSTRPDISTITNLLAQYNHKATKGHLDAAKHVLKYLIGTKHLGICFHSRKNTKLHSFIKFPIPSDKVTPFTDANWGPQDQSKPKPHDPPVDIFKSRSLSGFLIWMNGPIHWSSRRQTITARSTAEAEIYATDECVKFLIYLRHILEELHLRDTYMPHSTTIYNDNAACVAWSHSHSTKGLRHIQIRENAIREQVQAKLISIKHIRGEVNLSDAFTKEDKDTPHFISIRDLLLEPRIT